MSDLLNKILSSAPRYKKRQRIGRGEGSKGKTSGRGQKGAGARGGVQKRIGFEGGQTEIYRRFPQRGFSNFDFATRLQAVNVGMLERFDDGATVDADALKRAGLISNTREGVKILGNGELTKKLTVLAASYTRSAHKLITDLGGTAQNDRGQPYEFRPAKTRRLQHRLDKRLASLGLPPEAAGGQGQDAKGPAKGGKKNGGKVTDAPESGEKASGGAARGTPSGGDSVADAPESGDKA